jgi:hypothetical protein
MFTRRRLEYNNKQCFLRGPCRDVIRRTIGTRVVRESVGAVESAGNKVSAEAVDSQVLEAVSRERLVQIADLKDLAGAVVICKVWRSAMAL